MDVTTTISDGTAVVEVRSARLTHPELGDFASAASDLIARGEVRLVIDLAAVTYIDSMAIGCLMDLYKQASSAGGTLKLAGLQTRVETMLTMAGAHHILEVYPDRTSAAASFGG